MRSGLGNGFDVATRGETTLLAGGGIGVAPLFGLAKRLLAAGKTPVAVLGFNTAEDVFTKMNSRRSACRLSSQRRTAAAARAAL